MTDGQKLLANEQMDCRRAGLAQASPLVPMAPMASMATMVLEAVTASLAHKLTVGILQPRLQLAAALGETDGFRSLRRCGQNWWKCELKVPAILMENELMDCLYQNLVKNELMDCLTKLLAKLLLE